MDPLRHRLYDLWEDFLQKMDSNEEDNCPGLLDCFIAVLVCDCNWKNGVTYTQDSRQQMAKLIRSTTPNISILDIHIVDFRHPPNRGISIIIIPKYWADRWDRVMAFDPDCRLALVLEAILKVMLVHQLAHWLSAPERSDTLRKGLYSLNLEYNVNTIRRREEFEPGKYVERIAGGGMAHFEGTRDDIYFPVNSRRCRKLEEYSSPPTEFLFSIREKGYACFTPCVLDIGQPSSALDACNR